MKLAGEDDPLRRFLERRIIEGWMPGAVWWVGGAGGPASQGAVGATARVPNSPPVGAATPYDLASLSKPLATALLCALLESDGRLDPAMPIRRWLPELQGSPYAEVSWLDLASHRSGLPAWRPLYLDARGVEGYLIRIAGETPAVAGGRTLYSDLGYIALGIALERFTGQTLDRLFDTRVARALSLPRIGYVGPHRRFDDAAPTEQGNAYERRATGDADHDWRRQVIVGEVHDANAHALGGVAGHAGLFGTAGEVAAIVMEILAPRRLTLTSQSRQRLLRPVVPGSRTLGWQPAAHSRAARGILPDAAPGHTGFTGTSVWLDPRRGGIWVLLTNRVHPRVEPRDFQWLRRGFHRLAVRRRDRP